LLIVLVSSDVVADSQDHCTAPVLLSPCLRR
jgi:hypothetical protein